MAWTALEGRRPLHRQAGAGRGAGTARGLERNCRCPSRPPSQASIRLSVRFTRAPNYAIVAITLDDGPASLDRVSLYAPQMVAADPLGMGEHVLAPGAHRLRFTIVGAHPQAEPGYVVRHRRNPRSSACDKGATGWAPPRRRRHAVGIRDDDGVLEDGAGDAQPEEVDAACPRRQRCRRGVERRRQGTGADTVARADARCGSHRCRRPG